MTTSEKKAPRIPVMNFLDECDSYVTEPYLGFAHLYPAQSSTTPSDFKENAAMTAQARFSEQPFPAQDAPPEYAAQAVYVLNALDTGEWTLRRARPDPDFTEEYEREHRWSVQREGLPPYCDEEENRYWYGSTAYEALRKAEQAIAPLKTHPRYAHLYAAPSSAAMPEV